jgi:hypothetical protein
MFASFAVLPARIALGAILLAASTISLAVPRDGPAMAPGEKVAGMSQPELTAKWWQWAASFEYNDSPVADTTGERCGAGQEGEVFFLAGTYAQTVTHRTCKVPAGKTLFFPVINYVVMPGNCRQCRTCDSLADTARQVTDAPMGLFAELDRKALPALSDHRVATSACFNLSQRAKDAPYMLSASNGYWVALPPLPKGRHTLRFGGSLPSLRQELEYTLLVE